VLKKSGNKNVIFYDRGRCKKQKKRLHPEKNKEAAFFVV